ncbi:MAG: SGNH/GDSL hydrolase family protein [Butyrivibrio sp.]|nr:SGNH/GDSL hydrolase family protein [Butyrivibrio sp.]
MKKTIVNAPKDPTKKRPYLYILHNKDIQGAPQSDGSFTHYLYMDMGRLQDAARLTGNLTDEKMLKDMETARGFKEIVNSIGVSVSSAEPAKKVRFVAEMYPTVPGEDATVIEEDITMDGMETVIDFAGLELKPTDRVLGQFRFEFDTEGLQASADVRLYLNDGYEAPEQFEDSDVDTDSPAYKAMIAKSLMQTGNIARVKKVLEKAGSGEDVTLAFIGGSITQGAGAVPINEKCYARVFYEDFVKRYMKGGECTFVKAGIGGTPSELGMIRFERDVLRDGAAKPDMIVIEFAVNDGDDETEGICYESLVRKALALPWKPAVVLLFSVFSNDWNLQDRLSPVGRKYDLPMVSVLDAVSPQFPLLPKDGRVISKNLFFYDVYHPTNIGHKIMADCLMNCMDSISMMNDIPEDALNVEEIKPAIGADFETVELLDRKELSKLSSKYDIEGVSEGPFDKEDKDLQCAEIDKSITLVPQFPYNWHYDGSGYSKSFKMTAVCSRLLLIFKDSDRGEFGTAEILVDGKAVRDADPHVNNWTHCNAVLILNEEKSCRHEIEISMKHGMEDKKFTILGFGIVK